MKETRILMGMPITLEVAEQSVTQEDLGQVFAYFASVDERFSTYKDTSEISQINRGELSPDQYSKDMQTILALSEQTRQETNGYFDIRRNGMIDPSGLVKGWAIQHAAQLLKARGFRNFYIDAGGDIQIVGTKAGEPWKERDRIRGCVKRSPDNAWGQDIVQFDRRNSRSAYLAWSCWKAQRANDSANCARLSRTHVLCLRTARDGESL